MMVEAWGQWSEVLQSWMYSYGWRRSVMPGGSLELCPSFCIWIQSGLIGWMSQVRSSHSRRLGRGGRGVRCLPKQVIGMGYVVLLCISRAAGCRLASWR
jgi:hypothetical protein